MAFKCDLNRAGLLVHVNSTLAVNDEYGKGLRCHKHHTSSPIPEFLHRTLGKTIRACLLGIILVYDLLGW